MSQPEHSEVLRERLRGCSPRKILSAAAPRFHTASASFAEIGCTQKVLAYCSLSRSSSEPLLLAWQGSTQRPLGSDHHHDQEVLPAMPEAADEHDNSSLSRTGGNTSQIQFLANLNGVGSGAAMTKQTTDIIASHPSRLLSCQH